MGYGKSRISNISYVRRDMGKYVVQFYALHRETGHPLTGIDIEVFEQRYVPDDREYQFFEVAGGKTNSEGLFEFKKDCKRITCKNRDTQFYWPVLYCIPYRL